MVIIVNVYIGSHPEPACWNWMGYKINKYTIKQISD